MAGMEQLEIHSKSYIVRWVKVAEGNTISWSVHPHKKSINFGIVKHPGTSAQIPVTPGGASLAVPGDAGHDFPNLDSSISPDGPRPARRLSNLRPQVERNDSMSTAQDQLKTKGFMLKEWRGKCEADKVAIGTYAVGPAQGGMYGLVFDNTFSKTVSKTATFVLLTYPSNAPPNSTHHLQNPQGAMASAMNVGRQSSPAPGSAGPSESVDSLHSQASGLAASRTTTVSIRGETSAGFNSHVGVLQKRRRKKGQGYAKRYFSLDFVSCTLSYYYNRNSSALRGAIPLSLAAIAADERRREISIDSGAEVWHLKASNKKDFDEWTAALEKASSAARGLLEGPTQLLSPALQKLKIRTSGIGMASIAHDPEEERDWEQVEALVSRIAGTRDAVRRLTKNTKTANANRATWLGPSSASPPVNGEDVDYFGQEKRPFWKRKPSASTPRLFERSVSSQLAVPPPSATTVNGGHRAPASRGSEKSQEEQGIHEHCAALLNDLDSVLEEFSSLIANSRRRRMPPLQSAASRLSIDTTTTEQFFDAEAGDADGPQVMMINRNSDEDTPESERGDGFVSDDTSISSGADENMSKLLTESASFFPARAKSLAPLPLTTIVKRRKTVQPAKVLPPSLIAFLRKNVGKDFSQISMPVSANEPTSLLQRLSENLEYASLLDTASQQAESKHRLLHVAAFAVSTFANGRAKERAIRKPFNPMLGETFELVRSEADTENAGKVEGGYRFIAEKVCHRPVKLACQADAKNWTFTHAPIPTQKFWGKSAEIITEGRVRVVLRLKGGEDEKYSWTVATVFLRNVVMGEKYVEPVGTMTVLNETTGEKAVIEFKTKGMFGGRSEEVQVESFDANGNHAGVSLTGTWTQSLRQTEAGKSTAGREIWRVGRLVGDSANRYGFTEFAAGLNEITDEVEKGKLPPTDSRLRRDQAAAERGELDDAEAFKTELEEAQRARRARYEAEGREWVPRWFARVDGDAGEDEGWRLRAGKDGYWDERARGIWSGVEKVLDV